MEWFAEMNLSLVRPLFAPPSLPSGASAQACAHSTVFAAASNRSGAWGAQTQTHSGAWA